MFVALFHWGWGTCLSLYSAGSGVRVCRFIPLEVGYVFVALFHWRWGTRLSLYSTGGGVRVCRFIPLEVGYVFVALFHWRWATCLSLYSTGGRPFSGFNFGGVCLSCFFYILVACRVMVVVADSGHYCCVLSYTCDGQLSNAAKN